MANKKISDLAAANTPLDHTELMEVVQGGINKKVVTGEIGQNLEFVTFNTTPTPGVHVPGKLYWDEDAGTMAFMTDVTDVVLQVGQELHVKVSNRSGSQIDNGAAVYIDGAQGNRPTIELAQADLLSTSRLLGLATENIADNADGYVAAFGLVRDLDTSGFSDGDQLWLSDAVAGELVNVAPVGIAQIVGICVLSHNVNGIVLVRIIISQ